MTFQIPKLTKLFIGVFLFFLLSFILFSLSPVFNETEILNNIKFSPDFLTATTIVVLLVLDILFPIPSSILMTISGVIFGWFIGGLISMFGAVSSASINFILSRYIGQNRLMQWLEKRDFNRLEYFMKNKSVPLIIITRMMPLILETTNAIAGLSGLSFKKFLFINVVSYLPISFYYSVTGDIFKNQPQNVFVFLAIGFIAPLLLWRLFIGTNSNIS